MWFKRNAEQVPVIKNFYVLGTIIQLKVFGENAEQAINESIKRLSEIDDKMSVFKENSEVFKINSNAGGQYQGVSEDTCYVLETSLKYSSMSQGAFDPTIRPLVDLWGFGRENQRVPNKNEIEKAMELVNYNDININRVKKAVRLNKKNQSIDLGAVAKGFAADEIRDILIKNKIKSAIIDLGGNIFALGNKQNKTSWNIGIQDPLSVTGEYMGIISVSNKSVVTSGNYERFFIDNGKRYHHIMDSRTGYPSENGVISATIISDNSIDGDALTTCAYVMGLGMGYELIDKLDGVDAIFITEDKRVVTTTGIKDNFKLFNKDFNYVI
jgi:thiamine biosynthesis lipoprotein